MPPRGVVPSNVGTVQVLTSYSYNLMLRLIAMLLCVYLQRRSSSYAHALAKGTRIVEANQSVRPSLKPVPNNASRKPWPSSMLAGHASRPAANATRDSECKSWSCIRPADVQMSACASRQSDSQTIALP